MKLGWRLFFRYLGGTGSKAAKHAGSPFSVHAAGQRATTRQIMEARCMRYLRALAYVFNAHTLIVLLIANISVYVCLQADFRFNMDFSLVATGTIFPLTYTISQAYSEQRGCMPLLQARMLACMHAICTRHVRASAYQRRDLSFCLPSAARRERATVLIANLKASVAATYYMHR
jgi:hypothetical protein